MTTSLKRYIGGERIIYALILLLSCAASVALGKDVNWDLLNYHLYNPFMLLNGRLTLDLIPAQTQTFINPLMDIPTYFMITSLRPVIVGAIMGMIHGLNLILIYHVTRRMFGFLSDRPAVTIAIAITVCSGTGSIVRGLWGSFMGDLTVSIFVLAALDVFLSAPRHGTVRASYLMTAGALIGMGSGLKTTVVVFAVPLVALSPIYGTGVVQRLKTVAISGFSFALGLLVTYGYWGIILQQHFGSPLFPYFNGIFRSPYATPHNLTDFYRWIPQSLAGHLLLPFSFILPDGGLGQAEIYFREWRPAIAFVALLLLGAALVWRVGSGRRMELVPWERARPMTIVLVFFGGSWAIWQVQFAYYRYLAALELVIPLVILSAVYLSIPHTKLVFATLTGLILVLPFSTVPLDYGRQPWTEDYFEVHIPSTLDLEGAQLLIADLDRPLAFLIPFLPPSVQVVRLTSNMGSQLAVGEERGSSLIESSRRRSVRYPNTLYTQTPLARSIERAARVERELTACLRILA